MDAARARSNRERGGQRCNDSRQLEDRQKGRLEDRANDSWRTEQLQSESCIAPLTSTARGSIIVMVIAVVVVLLSICGR